MKINFKYLNLSTWISDVDSVDFCPDGSMECSNANLPRCQDRTIQCLEELPAPGARDIKLFLQT